MFNIQPNHNNQKPKTMFKIQPTPASSNVAGQIFYTTDYEVFKELLGNRDIDEGHVKKLIKSMREEYLEIPIQVNQRMEVIDGQHRLAACKELGLPIYYTVSKGAGLEETQRQNALSKKWTMIDVLESFCKRGFDDYIKVRHFMKDFNFTLQQTLVLLNLNTDGKILFIFRNGEFKIKDYEKSKKIARQLLAIWKVVPINDNIVFRSFFTLLTRCNEFDVNVFLDKMQYQSKKFKKQRDVKLQIEVIEDIYNFRNRSKINLRIIK